LVAANLPQVSATTYPLFSASDGKDAAVTRATKTGDVLHFGPEALFATGWYSTSVLHFRTRPSLLHAEAPMVRKVTLRQMGGSVGATIPKDMAERLHVRAGDEVFVIETEKGVLVTPFDPEFQRAMVAYERTARKYRNVLRELAK
jgi:putative addiction module antidote